MTDALKIARLEAREKRAARRAEREERLWKILENPNVQRVGIVFALMAGARMIRDSNMGGGVKATAVATATIGTTMIAADAGIHDKYALAAIAAIVAGATGLKIKKGDPVLSEVGGQDITLTEALASAGSGGVPLWYDPFDR